MVLLPLATVAAASRCGPVTELTFRAELLDLRTALELDRPGTHEALVDRTVAEAQCLAFVLPPRLWAELLVHVALREFAAGRDWQPSLGAALRLHADLERPVGPGHPLFDWVPGDVEVAHGEATSPGLLWWVDGEPALKLPTDGVHLVQVTDGRWWGSAVSWGDGLPEGWVRDPIDPPAHLSASARLGVVGGAAALRQRAEPVAADWFPTDTRASGLGAVVGSSRIAAWSPVGVAVDGLAGFTRDARLEGRATVAVSAGRSFVGVGVGGARLPVATGDGGQQWTWLPYPAVSAGASRVGPARAFEVLASGGGAAAVRSGTVEIAWGPSAAGPEWRLVGRADGAVGRFAQPTTHVTVTTSAWSAALGVAISARSDP